MRRSVTVLVAGMVIAATLLNTAEPVGVKKRRDELANLKWGMFICWSLSTFSGREWTPGVKDVGFFRAKECDTDQWARTAKEAGMGYILFLTKHHDGFCLGDTKTTDRKVTKAPLGRDVRDTQVLKCIDLRPPELVSGIATLPASAAYPTGSSLSIDGNFPAGNILVDRIEGDDAFIRQDLRDTDGWWFYWHFRVRQAGGRDQGIWQRTLKLSQYLESCQTGPLRHDAKRNVPFGTSWNQGNGLKSSTFAAMASGLPGIQIATTIEVPYSQVSQTPQSAAAARSLGRDLAVAIKTYLEKESRPGAVPSPAKLKQ